MGKDSTTTDAAPLFGGEAWFDPIEAGLRERMRGLIEELIEEELSDALGRQRYQRGRAVGHRHGKRERSLLGTFGPLSSACRGPVCMTRTGAAANGAARRCHAMLG